MRPIALAGHQLGHERHRVLGRLGVRRQLAGDLPWRTTTMRSQTCRMSVKRWLISRIATPRSLSSVDEVDQHADLLGRERRGGLVHEQQARLELEGAGDGHHLALAARQRARPRGAGPRRRPELAHACARPASAMATRSRSRERAVAPLQLAPEEDVGRDVEVVAEREVLVDHLDAGAPGVERAAELDRAARRSGSLRRTAGRRRRGS